MAPRGCSTRMAPLFLACSGCYVKRSPSLIGEGGQQTFPRRCNLEGYGVVKCEKGEGEARPDVQLRGPKCPYLNILVNFVISTILIKHSILHHWFNNWKLICCFAWMSNFFLCRQHGCRSGPLLLRCPLKRKKAVHEPKTLNVTHAHSPGWRQLTQALAQTHAEARASARVQRFTTFATRTPGR